MQTPFILSLFVSLILICQSRTASKEKLKNKLLYIILDGFRYDYLDDQEPKNIPGFTEFLEEGVRAEYMTPTFPSTSYQCWTTLATGLWPESHGIVGNYFYDSEMKDSFAIFDADATAKEKWWNSEPIWTTATKNGLRTAVILYSRCDISYDGVVPEFCEPFIKIKGPEIYQTNTIKALDKLDEGFDFVILYNEYMDNVGHDDGPETEARRIGIQEMDLTMSYMLKRIKKMGMEDTLNIVIVSDHGMVTTGSEDVKKIKIDDYLLTDYIESIRDGGTFANIKVEKEENIQTVYEKLKEMPDVDVYLHNEIPDRFHYKNNKYIHDIILAPHIDAYMLGINSSVQLPIPSDLNAFPMGAHGYDPEEEKMRAIFFAKGPAFIKNQRIPAIKNVDVYPLLAKLLKVTPRPNNGTLLSTSQALLPKSSSSKTAHSIVMISVIAVLTSISLN